MTAKLLMTMGALVVLFYFNFWLGGYRYHPAFEAAEQYAFSTAALHDVVGADVRVGRYPRGRIHRDDGTAQLTLGVRGDVAAGTLKVTLQRSTPVDWRVTGAEFITRAATSRLPTRDSTNVVDAVARTARGFALYQRSMYAEALAVLDSAIADNSRHAPAHYWRGVVLGTLGDQQAARAAFQVAVTLAPGDAASLTALGIAHGRLGDNRSALMYLDRAIAADSQKASAWYSRAIAYRRMGEKEKAIADLARACGMGYDRACDARRQEGL